MHRTRLVLAGALLLACTSACTAPPAVVAAREAIRDLSPDDTLRDGAPPTAEDARAVAKLVQDYLRVRPAGIAPNPYWQRDEQRRFPWFDIAGMETYRYATFRGRYEGYRVAVAAPPPGLEPGVLEATVHFVPRDSLAVRPARVRLYARRERGAWRLGGALPQLTRAWPEQVIGRIRFRVQPGVRLDTAVAHDGARFLDSLATAFDTPRDGEVLYVVAADEPAGLRTIGLEGGDQRLGGVHFGRNRLVVSAGGGRDPHLRHELVHAALDDIGDRRLRHRLASEGVAEWMAWRARPIDEVLGRQQVRRARGRRPALTLVDVARQRRHDADGDSDPDAEAMFYPTSAWLVGRVFEASGVDGVRELLEVRRQEPEEFLAVAQRRLGVSRKVLDAMWDDWMMERVKGVVAP